MQEESPGILLDSGNNEVELLEFYLGEQSFGINVAKIRQMAAFDPKKVTQLPMAHPWVIGSLLWMDRSIELVDMSMAMGHEPVEITERTSVIVTEFNNFVRAFLVSGINRIHRITWKQIQETGLDELCTSLVGCVQIGDLNVLMVNLEQLAVEIDPSSTMLENRMASNPALENFFETARVMVVEDSNTIRAMIVKKLGEMGCQSIISFENGEVAHEWLKKHRVVEEGTSAVSIELDLIVTDIEMPQMDGLTLCRLTKEELHLTVPVIVFSSLITNEMAKKCESVGADGHACKSNLNILMEQIDHTLQKRQPTAA